MNNQICELFEEQKLLFKKLETLDFARYSKKRSFEAFLGVDMKGFYTLIFVRRAKSKLLSKELDELNQICGSIESEREHAIKKRILFFNSAICSKILKNESAAGWKFYDFM